MEVRSDNERGSQGRGGIVMRRFEIREKKRTKSSGQRAEEAVLMAKRRYAGGRREKRKLKTARTTYTKRERSVNTLPVKITSFGSRKKGEGIAEGSILH